MEWLTLYINLCNIKNFRVSVFVIDLPRNASTDSHEIVRLRSIGLRIASWITNFSTPERQHNVCAQT